MSIQKRTRKKGSVYVVHYYDTDARKYRNRTFSLRKDATAFEAMVNLAKRRGELAKLDAGLETLDEFLVEWWSRHGDRYLAKNTRKEYTRFFKSFIQPALGDLPLRRISPSSIAAMRDRIQDANGDETARKAVAALQGVLQRAVEWERIRDNPAKAVKKPARSRKSRPRPLDPVQVEAIRSQLAERDAALVSVMAYAGLRPGEALALTWEDVGEQTLDISKAVALGEQKETKTGRSRIVRPYNPALSDLRGWRLASGLRSGPIFLRPSDHSYWRDTDYRNWRTRVWKPVANVRPYDLRHSFASLLFQEGRSPAYIAEQMGHSVQTLLSTYIHIIEELRDADRVDAEELIDLARGHRGLGHLGDLWG